MELMMVLTCMWTTVIGQWTHVTIFHCCEYVITSKYFLHRYIAMQSANWSDDQNLHKHETFYSAVQTCCYIVCFHGVSLGSLIRDSPVDQQNWEVTMTSKYQPLKFCLQSVRVEFLRLSRDIDMFPSVWRFLNVI